MKTSLCKAAFCLVFAATANVDARTEQVRTEVVQFIGRLTEQADKRCRKGQVEWVNKHFEVGFVQVVKTDVPLRLHLGSPVAVTGRILRAYSPPKVEHLGQCPISQMRSDWIEGMHGMRVRRGKPVGFQYLHVTAVKPFRSLKAKLRGSKVVVSYTNHRAANVTLRVHYEGCYGKPDTMQQQRRVKDLRLGRSRSVSFSAFAERKVHFARKGVDRGRVQHVATSVSLDAPLDDVVVDLNIPLRSLGVTLSCPRGKR
ncbi:MAG: hypothetical protein JRH20_14225 [Deltaproteobacteria bacterium]|nr:hypothetical protein [Deltaproteobacteria bacterium]